MQEHYRTLELMPWELRRTNVVTDANTTLMIIDDASGLDDGKLFTAMLKTIPLNREDICFTTISNELLDEQITLMKPQLLLVVGLPAAHHLLKTKASLESMRNQLHHYHQGNMPLIITYHPNDLLKSPIDKKKAFLDLQFVRRTLGE
ncbi:MAG: uracil-DNA glycosylase family protein [Gammaproteobacteria bacterium]